jgi:Flp pilus assembly protein TadD
VRARLLAAEGRPEQAEALAAEAVRLAERTDFLTVHAEVLVSQGMVLREAGRSEEGEAAIRSALELYRRKGDVVSVERTRGLLAEDAPSLEG